MGQASEARAERSDRTARSREPERVIGPRGGRSRGRHNGAERLNIGELGGEMPGLGQRLTNTIGSGGFAGSARVSSK